MAKKKTKERSVKIDDIEEKKKALANALAHVEKDFGAGAIMRLGDNAVQNIETVSTGSIGIDFALGVGGVPRGRITEIFGPESSGKTTLALHIIAEAQKEGGVCAIIDAEHAFDRFYAERLGVNVNELLISQPDNGEQALDIAEQLINSGAIDVLVIDSVAALTPKAEIEGVMGDKNMGLHARLMSQAMRKLTGTISRTRTCCIFINQLRQKIGVSFGNPETTTGGNALKFYSTVRIEIRPTGVIKEGEDAIGRTSKVKIVKNKVAPPFMKTEIDLMFGEGMSREGEVLDMAVELNIVKKSGAWFSYGDKKLGNGRDNVKNYLKENRELYNELEKKVRETLEKLRTESGSAVFNPFSSKKKKTKDNKPSSGKEVTVEEIETEFDDDDEQEEEEVDDIFDEADFDMEIEE